MVYEFYTLSGVYLGKESDGPHEFNVGMVLARGFHGHSCAKWEVVALSDLTGGLHMVVLTPLP